MCCRYGKLIVLEHFLAQKSVVMDTHLGGLAGGDKYVVRNILFKISRDVIVNERNGTFLYGGQERSCAHPSLASCALTCLLQMRMPTKLRVTSCEARSAGSRSTK